MKEYSREDYVRVLGQNLTESKIVDNRMEEVYDTIRGMAKQKKSIWKNRIFVGMSAVAAMLVLAVTVTVTNPTLAAKLPIVNTIFKNSQQQVSYKGNYSENSIPLVDTELAEANEAGTEVESPYICTAGGVTVTIGEAYYNTEALYLGINIYTKEGFSKEFRAGCMVQDEYADIRMESVAKADLSKSGQGVLEFDAALGTEAPYSIEGNFIDENNFSGIIRVPLEFFGTVDEAGNFTQVMPSGEFTYSLNIKEFYDDYESENKIAGPWEFTFDVALDTENTAVKEVNETNEDGIGISNVTKTLYEVKADLILPEGASKTDYMVVIYDKEGNPLDSQGGSNAEVYSLSGRDTSEITIGVFDYVTYMDECKTQNIKDVSEKCLFETTVEL